jgi:hypothetical protein
VALLASLVSPPAPPTECLDLVRGTYAHLSRPAESGSVYRLLYTVHTVRRTPAADPGSRSTVEVVMNRDQVRLTSPELVAYQDEESSITILPAQKIVSVGPSTLDLQRERRLQGLALFQDRLFDSVVVQGCEDLPVDAGKAGKRVVLVLDEEGRQRFPMHRITYDVDAQGDSVRRVLMEYPDSHALARVEITFHAIDYAYQTHDLDSPIRSAVFDAQGRLLPRYSAFTLIDRLPSKPRDAPPRR